MITRISIEGYKSIKQLEIGLGPVNILLGANGAGKSNFISVFALLRSIYQQQLQWFVAKKGGADRLLYYGKKHTQQISVDIAFGDPEGERRFMVDLQVHQDTLLIAQTQTAYPVPEGWRYQLHDQHVRESAFKDDPEGRALYAHLQSFTVYHFHDTGEQSPLKGKCRLDDNRALAPDGTNLPAFLYYLQQRHAHAFAKIQKAVQTVAPFFQEFVLAPDSLNEAFIQLEWKDKGDADAYFNAYDLSDGTLRFIALATLLLQPNPPATIIIDEPELGLHPVALNKLAALVRKASKRTQIILSTQSTNLIDNFEPEDMIVVDRKDNASMLL